jgi:hypothetical protein
VGLAYVSFPRAAYNAIGEGQLFFVAAALAGECLAIISKRGGGSPLTIASLWGILFLFVALFTAATIWKERQPPRQNVANVIVIGGSVGMVAWGINIALGLLG